jgi:beta-phosphoglucomutase-like phosphatase (HAD superfamily)
MSRKILGVIFDLDGTLIHSEWLAEQAASECFSRWNIQLTTEDRHAAVGVTWAKAFDFLFSKYSVPVSRSEAEQEIFRVYHEKLEQKFITAEGAVAAIQKLSQTRPLAVVSGSSRADIHWALHKMGVLSYFQFYLGAEDYPQSKPAPDGFQKAALHRRNTIWHCRRD